MKDVPKVVRVIGGKVLDHRRGLHWIFDPRQSVLIRGMSCFSPRLRASAVNVIFSLTAILPSSSRTPSYRTPGLPSAPLRSVPAWCSHLWRPSASKRYFPAHLPH